MVAGSGQLWQSGIVVMADTAALFWASVATWATLRATRLDGGHWLVGAGAALGMAIVTRWLAVILIVPFAAALLVAPRTSWRGVLAGVLVLGLVVLPQAVITVLQPGPGLGNSWFTAWSPLNAVRNVFETPEGQVIYDLPVGIFSLATLVSPGFLPPLVAPFAILGAFALARWRRWSAFAVLVGWCLAVLVALGGIPYQNVRYFLLLLPALAVLAIVGLATVRLPQPLVALLIVLSLAYGLRTGHTQVSAFLNRNDRDLAVARWVERQTEPGARVIAFEISLTLQHETGLRVVDLYELTTGGQAADDPNSLSSLLAAPEPLWLVARLWRIEQQWPGRSPDLNYRWLRDNPGLDRIGEHDGYTLFQVRQPKKQMSGRSPIVPDRESLLHVSRFTFHVSRFNFPP